MLRRGISFGRIAGIPIHASWTWLPIVALIVWTLAADVFPNQNPGLSDTTYIVMAVVAAAVFFASLVLHELGHALQARREGMKIDGIVLWLFGGIARFTGEFPSAGAEFRVAVAGPLVSLGIGVLSLGLAVAAPLPTSVDGVAAWLGYTNLVLLTFNLLPAYPLDGGWTLDSWLGRLFGPAWSVRIVASLGLLIAAGLIVLWALPARNVFLGFVAIFLGMTNWQALQSVGGWGR
jgi:Zn-dependent protease